MIRVNPNHWTADFRIARALTEAFKASGFEDVLFFCVGDPGDAIGRLAALVADETMKYYPNVMGAGENPVTPDTLVERVEEAMSEWPGRFVVAIEPGAGLPSHLGSIEITDRGLTTAPASADSEGNVRRFADVTVNVVLRVDDFQTRRRESLPRDGGAGLLGEAEREIGSDNDAGLQGRREKFQPLRPAEITPAVVRKLADIIIDGNLRFLSKIGKQEL